MGSMRAVFKQAFATDEPKYIFLSMELSQLMKILCILLRHTARET